MKKLYINYALRFLFFITSIIYFFFINTDFEFKNLLPFSLILIAGVTALYFLFNYDKRNKQSKTIAK